MTVLADSKNKIENAKNRLGEWSNGQNAGYIPDRRERTKSAMSAMNAKQRAKLFFQYVKKTPWRVTLNFVKFRAKTGRNRWIRFIGRIQSLKNYFVYVQLYWFYDGVYKFLSDVKSFRLLFIRSLVHFSAGLQTNFSTINNKLMTLQNTNINKKIKLFQK